MWIPASFIKRNIPLQFKLPNSSLADPPSTLLRSSEFALGKCTITDSSLAMSKDVKSIIALSDAVISRIWSL